MKRYINKIKNHLGKYGFKETLSWLYNCVKFKIIQLKSVKKDFLYDVRDNRNFIKKNGNRVFIFGTVPFYDIGGGQRSSQFAKTFNKMGFEVFYIYAFKTSDTIVYNIENPCVLHYFIKDLKIEYLANFIRKDDLFIFEAPFIDFVPYLDLALQKQAKVVYENIDNWENCELGGMIFSEDALQKFIKKSDLLTCTAKPLVEQTQKYCERYGISKEIMYNANAVDDELFNSKKEYEKPHDIVKGTKTLLYYGSLWGTWFNWDVLFDIAIKNPRISINLIGDHSGISDLVQNTPANIHYLGLKTQTELPAYLAHSDYAILPFYSDDIGKYVSPLKIFEYISMNKKVIAGSLPDIENYPNVINADTVEEWSMALNDDSEVDIVRAENFIQENNWYERSTRILDYLYTDNAQKCLDKYYNNLSVVILNYNNAKVIFRCVDSLLKFKERYKYQIIVVDNNSTDGSYEKLLNDYKNEGNVTIVRNSENGCSSGRNLGVSKSDRDYVLFLDSDEWITNKYWLDNYFNIMDMKGDKTAIGWGAGWFNKNKFAYHVVDSFPHRYLEPKYIATNDIGYLATCGFLINREFFNEIGGFDLQYDPTCYEDTDLSLNVRHNGGEIYFSKFLGVGHLPHQTTKSGTKAHDQLIHNKGKYFIKKWVQIDKKLLTKYRLR